MPDNDYIIGYCKPPESGKFKKGISGNPAGRPKGSKNCLTIIEENIFEMVNIKEHGKVRQISKLDAAIKQLSNKAAAGDIRAIKLITELAIMITDKAEMKEVLQKEPLEADQQVLDNLFSRLQQK